MSTNIINGIDFTNGARAEYDNIMSKLGKKTKKLFTEAVRKEFEEDFSDNHQMMNLADIIRVANKLNLP